MRSADRPAHISPPRPPVDESKPETLGTSGGGSLFFLGVELLRDERARHEGYRSPRGSSFDVHVYRQFNPRKPSAAWQCHVSHGPWSAKFNAETAAYALDIAEAEARIFARQVKGVIQ